MDGKNYECLKIKVIDMENSENISKTITSKLIGSIRFVELREFDDPKIGEEKIDSEVIKNNFFNFSNNSLKN